MNVIFLTLVRISNIEERHIYADLMRKFRDEGHHVYIVTAAERRLGLDTTLVDSHGVKILNVKTLNVQKTNIVEKGIGTLLIESQFKSAIKKDQRHDYEVIISNGFSWARQEDLAKLLKLFK